tara:strand:+ start:695 stop:1108 length:414 start_codon:yes stop_codon:yes gene_type:complete
MGNEISKIKRMSFEDIQELQKFENYILINTMPVSDQGCLIKGTVSINDEVTKVERIKLTGGSIVIYGKNGNDISIYNKYSQLIKLGYRNVYLYIGGIFEWLCLQDIYGYENFPTTKKELDILKYKPQSVLKTLLLTN